MKAATAIGIGLGFAGLLLGAIMEGTSPAAFFNIPALIIVLGGTDGATLATCGMDAMKRVPGLYKKSFSPEHIDAHERVELIVGLAEKARREGLLALEEDIDQLQDEFSRKGMQLVVDGVDPDLVREIMENEIDGMAARHHQGSKPFEKAGGFSPTMGIIGTVMGLVHVLGNLDQPATLGPAISGAFIATLYGVGAANVIFLPVAGRLQGLSHEEIELRTLTVEGILAIQAGDNPRVVADKLAAFLPPAEPADKGGSDGPGAEVREMPDVDSDAAVAA